MIKFFRKIRQKMLNENLPAGRSQAGKFSKYFLYAIGEILLVVFGILIALQIGAWAKENETAKLELKILKEVSKNLEDDLVEIQTDMEKMRDINTACFEIKKSIKTKNALTDEFFTQAGILRVTPHFDSNKSGYGLLKSKGVEIISNDSLRNTISNHYERSYMYYQRYEEERLLFHTNHSEPRLLEYFNMEFNTDVEFYVKANISSGDYVKLLKDESFVKLLSAIEFENQIVLNRAMRTEKSISSLLLALKNEVSIMDNK